MTSRADLPLSYPESLVTTIDHAIDRAFTEGFGTPDGDPNVARNAATLDILTHLDTHYTLTPKDPT